MVLEHLAEMSKDDAEYLRESIQEKRKWEDQARKEELEERAWTQGMEEGRTQGMEEGRTQGMEEGRTQGMEEGRTQGMHGIALSMLRKGYEVSEISEVTGLSVAKVEQLNGKTAD